MEYQNGVLFHDPTEPARNAIHAWLRTMSGPKFEGFVVELLTLKGARHVERTGGAGDGGIDGTGITGDFQFAFQAKQWDRDVPPKEVVNFLGALTNRGLINGYFFTSSRYTQQAREEVDRARERRIAVELYDGKRIADTMIENGFGVREVMRPVYEFDSAWWNTRLNPQPSIVPTTAPPPIKTKKPRRLPKRPPKTAKSRMIWDLCDEGRPPKEVCDIAEANGRSRKTASGVICAWRTRRAQAILDAMPDASEEDRVAALMKFHMTEKVARNQLRRARRYVV